MTDPIEDRLRRHACPRCGEVGTLRLVLKLRTRDPGGWSLAGVHEKRPAVEWPHAVCTATDCDFDKPARRAE